MLLTALGARGLAWWGAAPGGALYADAAAYLGVRALAAPFSACMLVLQGCFRCGGEARQGRLAVRFVGARRDGMPPAGRAEHSGFLALSRPPRHPHALL